MGALATGRDQLNIPSPYENFQAQGPNQFVEP
jgi:hypothetical protein